MKKFRFVLLAALLLAFSFMGCKLPETTYTYEFGIVDTADADKVFNRLYGQNVDFNDLEDAKETLYFYTNPDNYMKAEGLTEEDVRAELAELNMSSSQKDTFIKNLNNLGNNLLRIYFYESDEIEGWLYFEKE
jgi:hypothetical protein